MLTKKPASNQKRSRQTPGVTSAIKRGRAQAAAVVALRARQRKKRTQAVAARPAPRRAPGPRRIPASTLRALGPRDSVGLLIAEGDSWFDYPMHDVLSMLEDDHGYDVESVAHKGDRVEDMAYSGGQFEEFARRLEKLLRQGRVPDAILLSGGGNDIGGDEFAILLNHSGSALPAINQDIVHGVIDVRLRDAYAFLISGLTEISKRYLNRPIPILTHGYDYPIPDGRGFLGGWGPLPGPWLRPGFHQKGYADQVENAKVVRDLIDAFNEMLKQVSSAPQFQHVRYIDLRTTLAADQTYRKDWANELHPTERGFAAVTEKFANVIAGL
jgi:lysophospholipase L1-like esterase